MGITIYTNLVILVRIKHTWRKALFSANFGEDQIQRSEKDSNNKHRERLHSSIFNVIIVD